MSKEMIITSTPQETKVAILEDDQLVEVHIERSHEQGLVGSIYKGRVTKVLPGMQSAFVNVGLERDAFLYVSDFFEDAEEYDSVVTTVEEKIDKMDSTPGEPRSVAPAIIEIPTVIEPASSPAPVTLPPVAESAVTTQPPVITEKAVEAAKQEKNDTADVAPKGRKEFDRQGHGRYGRRRGRRRPWERNREEQAKPVITPTPETPPPPTAAVEIPSPSPAPMVSALTPLPGESLSKFQTNAPVESMESLSSETTPIDAAEFPAALISEAAQGAETTPDSEMMPPAETAPESYGTEITSTLDAMEEPILAGTAGEVLAVEPAADSAAPSSEPAAAPPAIEFASRTGNEIAPNVETAPAIQEGPPTESSAAPMETANTADVAPTASSNAVAATASMAAISPAEAPVIDRASFRTPLHDKLQVPSPSEVVPPEAPPLFSSVVDAGWEEKPESATAPAVEISAPPAGEAQPVEESSFVEPSSSAEILSLPAELTSQESIPEPVELAPEAIFAPPMMEAPHEEPAEPPSVAAEVPPVESAPASIEAIPSVEPRVTPAPLPVEIVSPEIPAVAAPKSKAAPPKPAEESSTTKAPSRFQEKHFGRARYDKQRLEKKAAAVPPAEVYGPPTPYEFMSDEEKTEYNARKAAEKISAKIQDSSRKLAAPQPRERDYGYQRGRRGRRGRKRFPDREPREEQAPAREEKKPMGRPMIADLLREGQEILVQIAKEPLGKKGARITSHIALPGRYLVYMPTVDHIGVSRKIGTDEERHRLKRIINENRVGLTGGFIVRTAAEGRTEEELKQDIRFLANLWGDIRSRAEKRPAPALLHRDLGVLERILRDQLSSEFTAIRLDNETEYAKVLEFVNQFQPALVGRVKLHFKDTPIFEEYGIDHEIEKALKAKVWLKSGGYIVINQTEAMVAIDVNTGKFVGKTTRLEDTIVKTNIDAAKEVARQVRLRDMGGIIVIDFIDMEERKNRQKVIQALEEAMHNDRAPYKILAFNDFGLIALTRKRVKQSLEKTLLQACSYCQGHGMIKSVQTVCYEIQAEAKKMGPLLDGQEIRMRVHPDVAKALKTAELSVITEIESHTRKDVIIKSDPATHQDQFEIY